MDTSVKTRLRSRPGMQELCAARPLCCQRLPGQTYYTTAASIYVEQGKCRRLSGVQGSAEEAGSRRGTCVCARSLGPA